MNSEQERKYDPLRVMEFTFYDDGACEFDECIWRCLFGHIPYHRNLGFKFVCAEIER
jgi:hypothetical protein